MGDDYLNDTLISKLPRGTIETLQKVVNNVNDDAERYGRTDNEAQALRENAITTFFDFLKKDMDKNGHNYDYNPFDNDGYTPEDIMNIIKEHLPDAKGSSAPEDITKEELQRLYSELKKHNNKLSSENEKLKRSLDNAKNMYDESIEERRKLQNDKTNLDLTINQKNIKLKTTINILKKVIPFLPVKHNSGVKEASMDLFKSLVEEFEIKEEETKETDKATV